MDQLNKKWHKTWWGILIILFVFIVLIIAIVFAFTVYHASKNIKNSSNSGFSLPDKQIDKQTLKLIEGQNNYWIGSANPKVTIVEFADFSCPNCEKSFSKIREIGLKYKNDVKIIFRNYPMYENSLNLAMAGRCAGEQGLFWLMHDKLFQNQGVGSNEELSELAKKIGADADKFNNCLNSNKYLAQIQQDFADGEKLGISGTPTWFINGNKVEGDVPYYLFNQILESLLKK